MNYDISTSAVFFILPHHKSLFQNIAKSQSKTDCLPIFCYANKVSCRGPALNFKAFSVFYGVKG